jgi:hypothetical protein
MGKGGVVMAKMLKNRRCVVCGQSPVLMWTIDNMSSVVVTYLCTVHGAPLQEIMGLAGDLPPDRQVPLPERDAEALDTHLHGRRDPKMMPLLNWTPPEDPGPVPEPEPKPISAEEIIVAQGRQDGKTWDEIGAMVGTTGQNAWGKYHGKYKARGPRSKAAR